jgi:hypothetical protein
VVRDRVRAAQGREGRALHTCACIILPNPITTQCGDVGDDEVLRVLRWLYFPRWATTMPYRSKEEDALDTCLDDDKWHQPWLSVAASSDTLININTTTATRQAYPGAFSLLSYWRCTAAMDRCAAMIKHLQLPTHALSRWLTLCQDGGHPELEITCILEMRRCGCDGGQWNGHFSDATLAKLGAPPSKKRKEVTPLPP